MARKLIQSQINSFNSSCDTPIIKWRCTDFCSQIDFYSYSVEEGKETAHYSLKHIEELTWLSMGAYNEGNHMGYRSLYGPGLHYSWLDSAYYDEKALYYFDGTLTWLTFYGQCHSIELEQKIAIEPLEDGQGMYPPVDYTASDFELIRTALGVYFSNDYKIREIEGLYYGDEVHVHMTHSSGKSVAVACCRIIRVDKIANSGEVTEVTKIERGGVTININYNQVFVDTVILTFSCNSWQFRIEFVDLRISYE